MLAPRYKGHGLAGLIELQDDVFIGLQHSQLMRAISRTIPISNTEASKYLRMAAAESIIAKKLTETMLQPLYILDPTMRNAM